MNEMSDESTSSERLCRHCKLVIDREASVCPHCQKHQGTVWVIFDKIGVVGALILIIIACLQFVEARQQRIEAQKAVAEAKEARSQAQDAAAQAQQTANLIKKTEQELRQLGLSLSKISYLQLAWKGNFAKENQIGTNEIVAELNRAIKRSMPDNEKRDKWLRENVNDYLPEKQRKKKESQEID